MRSWILRPSTLGASLVLLFSGVAQGAGLYDCPLHSHGGEADLASPDTHQVDGSHTGADAPGCDCGLTCIEARTVLSLPKAGDDSGQNFLFPPGAHSGSWALLPDTPRTPIPFFLPPAHAPPPQL